jgi:hypothetical protein
MKVIAVVTIFGEVIGRAADDFSEETIERERCIHLDKPLKLQSMPTPQGMMNVMLPVAQLLPCEELDIALHHVVAFGEAPEAITKNYLEMTSGIAMSSGGGRGPKLEIVRG